MAKILNIETSTDICSVCVSHDGEVVGFQESNKGFNHASTVTIFIQQCLEECNMTLTNIDAVAMSQGPGSYTGLRIGVSVAKGICYALNKPMIAIDTLQALAWACAEEEKQDAHYCAMVDARRMEVYTAVYDEANKEEKEIRALIVTEDAFDEYFSKKETVIFCGNGAEKCKPILTSPYAKFSAVICSSLHLNILSQKRFESKKFVDTAYFSPLYYKSPNITIPKKIL